MRTRLMIFGQPSLCNNQELYQSTRQFLCTSQCHFPTAYQCSHHASSCACCWQAEGNRRLTSFSCTVHSLQ